MGRISNKIKLSNKLKQKSIEAFLLCIETYNKPTINYRIEASSYLLCNAWELLLKSHYILKNGVASIYRKSDSKSFSLEEMLAKYYKDNSPIRINLNYIIENIRNKATHFIIKNHDTLYTPLLQKAILNYVDEIGEKLGVEISDYIPLESLALLVKREKRPTNLSKMYGKSFADMFVKDEENLASFIQTNTNINDNCEIIAVVESKLAFVKDPNKANIKAYYDKSGTGLREVIVSKDVEISHPYTMKQVINQVKEILSQGFNLNGLHNSSLGRYNKANNIVNKPEFFKAIPYGKNNIKKYSQAYIDQLIEDIKNNPTKFSK